MSEDELEIKNAVKGMAALVLNSNRISEIHEKNMKTYPFIFFEGVKEVKIDYDLSHESNVEVDKENNLKIKKPLSNCHVTYDLIIKEGAENPNIDRRISALEASTKTLFWKDLLINIKINGKLVNGK